MKVYSISGAPRCWRVLVGLTLKGLDYDVHYLEASKQEHKSDEFLQINPRGKVPVLDANGLLVRDSVAILAWLDHKFPDKPLFGDTVDQAATIWQVSMECREYVRSASFSLLFPILVRNVDLGGLESTHVKAMQEGSQRLHDECRRLERLLSNNRFLCGNVPTAAEAFAFPEIQLIGRALDRKQKEMAAFGFEGAEECYPGLFEWSRRVSAIPGMDKTLPPHW